MNAYTYILICSDNTYYTGSTKNIARRIEQHTKGVGANHTRKRLPVKLVYLELYDRIDVAFEREKQIQRWSSRKKQALINSDSNQLIAFSKKDSF